MDIHEILKELKTEGIIKEHCLKYDQLSGGTTSKLFLIHNENTKLVVKLNEPKVLEQESYFLDFYKTEKVLPRLLYVESSYKYIVYSFITGSVSYPRKNKKELLISLVQNFINHYKTTPNPTGWGWADEVSESWESFLLNRVNAANEILDKHLDNQDFHFVLELVKSPNRISNHSKPFLLHGDCGVHNFILNDGILSGVIDPTPVLGDPLYDLIYAFCSSPDDLSVETIECAAAHLITKGNKNGHILIEEVVIGLYLRLASCAKHHPNDFEEYLTAWNYWKMSLENETRMKK
jgi:fructosamine-3-kinase